MSVKISSGYAIKGFRSSRLNNAIMAAFDSPARSGDGW
jgi:hypothetical protein